MAFEDTLGRELFHLQQVGVEDLHGEAGKQHLGGRDGLWEGAEHVVEELNGTGTFLCVREAVDEFIETVEEVVHVFTTDELEIVKPPHEREDLLDCDCAIGCCKLLPQLTSRGEGRQGVQHVVAEVLDDCMLCLFIVSFPFLISFTSLA